MNGRVSLRSMNGCGVAGFKSLWDDPSFVCILLVPEITHHDWP